MLYHHLLDFFAGSPPVITTQTLIAAIGKAFPRETIGSLGDTLDVLAAEGYISVKNRTIIVVQRPACA